MQSNFVTDLMTNRRSMLKGLGVSAIGGLAGGLGATLSPNPAAAAMSNRSGGLDWSDPKDNLWAFGKIWAGYDEPVIGSFYGLMYARIGNKRMIPLFGYEGTGCLQCKWDPNGFLNIKSRETGYFTDLVTGEPLKQWYNPFTEETVEVYDFYNDLLGGRLGTQIPKFAMGGSGDSPTLMNEGTVFPDENGEYPFLLPFEQYGEDLLLSWDYTHEYTNPVTPEGWPKSSTGKTITPSEHFLFYVDRNEVEDRSIPAARFRAGFSRQCNWWPFMKMGGSKYQDGVLIGRMFSQKGLPGTQSVRPKLLDYIEKHAPEYLTLPDGWPIQNHRVGTWESYRQDIPPENPDYEWTTQRRDDILAPPTGSGSTAGKGI